MLVQTDPACPELINTELCAFRRPRYISPDFLVGVSLRHLVCAAAFVFFHASAHSSTAFCRIAHLAVDASLHCLSEPCAALPNSAAALARLLLLHSLENLHVQASSVSTPLYLERRA